MNFPFYPLVSLKIKSGKFKDILSKQYQNLSLENKYLNFIFSILIIYSHKKRRPFYGPPTVDFDLLLSTYTSQHIRLLRTLPIFQADKLK